MRGSRIWTYQPLDELGLIVEQLRLALADADRMDQEVALLFEASDQARSALARGERTVAADALSTAYHAGRAAWQRLVR